MKLVRVRCHVEQDRVPVGSLDLHPELVSLFEEMGLVEVQRDTIQIDELLRLNKILRLRKALGANLIGAAIIVDLLARIERLEDELECLRGR